jgi:hypothetical protein
MKSRFIAASMLALSLAAPVLAQHGEPAPSHVAPREASQYDFLIGEWEIVAEPRLEGLAARIHGNPKFPGTWKAWRGLDGWGIEDEIRLTDASGNPHALTHFLRSFDTEKKHWMVASLDIYRARLTSASGEWRDGEMHIDASGTDADGRAFVSRSRFHAIGPNGFRFQQDRSYDDGRTWTEGHLRIVAKRVAAVVPR